MSVIRENIVAYGHGTLQPSYFCVHSTANPGATAANHSSYWTGSPDYAVHLVSDWTQVLHTVPYDRLCWQVGNGNSLCEGIEICEATNQADFDRGIQLAAQAVRERLAAHGWGVDRLICHDDARRMWGGTDHTDPIDYFARWGYSWSEFKQLVASGDDQIKEDTMSAALLIRDDDTQVIYYWTPETGLTGLGHPDQAAIIEKAGVPLVHSSSKASWATRAAQVTGLVQSRTLAYETAQTAALQAMAKAIGADPDTIAKAVKDAVTAKLDALEISVTATDK